MNFSMDSQNSKGLLSRPELEWVQKYGFIQNSLEEHLNQTSIDITLGGKVLAERIATVQFQKQYEVSLRERQPLNMVEVEIGEEGIVLAPGQFILACSEQVFNLPLDLSAEYKLKSSMARIGLEHMNAGWCDPGWHGSVLTLELKNMTEYHHIRLHKGVRIGQVVFFHHLPVMERDSYAHVGRYNNDNVVKGIKP